ncbi:MAG: trans-AT polyketide synthase/acyltransferase/oxidoreductase domain-containing protein, partial [Vicingaceae bacterium]
EQYENRKVADVAIKIMEGAAYLYRIQSLKMQGVDFPKELEKVGVFRDSPIANGVLGV